MISNKSICENKLMKAERQTIPFGNVKITIYWHSPLLLNVTGSKSMQEVKRIQNFIETAFNVQCKNLKIDNIFYSHKDYLSIDLNKLYYYLRERYKDKFVIDYNIELFPGLYMKSRIKGFPTLILFRTGSYTILGSKSIEMIKKCKTFIHRLYKIHIL